VAGVSLTQFESIHPGYLTIIVVAPLVLRPVLDAGECLFHAASGHQAIELLKMAPFDWVLIGRRVPGMSLCQFLERARRVRPDFNWAQLDVGPPQVAG
jgi:CheY-like chemotaxis protein